MSSTSASSEPAGCEQNGPNSERVLVGVVLRPHGIRGEVKVDVQSDVESRFANDAALHLVVPGGPDRRVRVAGSRRHKGGVLLRFDGIDDRDAADALRGARLEVDEADVPAPPDGFYYHFQLVGCEVRDARHGHLGVVRDVVEDGGGSLLIVDKDGGRLPIPFVDAFLRQVDVRGRRIDIDLPPGLIETCTSRS